MFEKPQGGFKKFDTEYEISNENIKNRWAVHSAVKMQNNVVNSSNPL